MSVWHMFGYDTDVNVSSLQVSTFPESPSTCSFQPLMEDHWTCGGPHPSLSVWALPLAPNCEKLQQAQASHIHMEIWEYRGAAASANQTQSEQRDLQHRDPDMTPTIISKEHLRLNNKVHSPPTYSSITAAALTAFLNHWLIWSTLS